MGFRKVPITNYEKTYYDARLQEMMMISVMHCSNMNEVRDLAEHFKQVIDDCVEQKEMSEIGCE